jgi:hypothetical protein
MSAGKLSAKLSLTAAAQLAMMSKAEKDAFKSFFTSEAGLSKPNTKAIEAGGFVSRVAGKRVLWRRRADNKPEIQTIVDESYSRSGVKANATG